MDVFFYIHIYITVYVYMYLYVFVCVYVNTKSYEFINIYVSFVHIFTNIRYLLCELQDFDFIKVSGWERGK